MLNSSLSLHYGYLQLAGHLAPIFRVTRGRTQGISGLGAPRHLHPLLHQAADAQGQRPVAQLVGLGCSTPGGLSQGQKEERHRHEDQGEPISFLTFIFS